MLKRLQQIWLRPSVRSLYTKVVLQSSSSTVNNGQVQEGELQAIGIECDVSSELAVKSAMTEVVERFGRIDSLVASAGKRICDRSNYFDAFHYYFQVSSRTTLQWSIQIYI